MLKRHFLFLVCSLSLWNVAYAGKVTEDAAAKTAAKIMEQRVAGFSGSIQSITGVVYEDETTYYIVQFAPEGWILIAADDMSSPLLGYSGRGVYQKDGQPDNVKYWLKGYSRQIQRNSRLNGKRHQGWETLDSRTTTRAANDKINPLITVNWNQGRPYNQFCPSNNSGTAVVGCVAVAMAQAMSVAQYPAKPQGEYRYMSATYGSLYVNYEEEEAYNWNAILSGADNKKEVARLLYHCGISLKMDYGVDGSGTQTSYMPAALIRNFDYPSSVKFYLKENYHDDWEQLILNELNASRAVCYSGTDTKKGYGHCFNLDGYDGSFFHVNWGWGGANNGYFPLDGLRDNTMDMDYTAHQGVVVGIRPPSEAPMNIILSAHTIEANKPAGTVVADVTIESEAKDPVYKYDLKGPYSIIFHDYLASSFIIEDGKLKTKEAFDIEDGDRTVYIKVTNAKNNKSLEQVFTINVTPATGIENVKVETNRKLVFYEKASRSIHIMPNEAIGYAIYTADGKLADKGDLAADTETIVSASSFLPGLFIIQLIGMEQNTSQKLIIR